MSLLFFLPFLTAAADDAANAYVYQMEKRIMAAWHLPKGSAGLTVALRMNFERSGRLSAVRVEQSSGNKDFDESAVEAVRRVAEFPPVPHALDHLIGDLVIVLDPTPAEQTPKAEKPPSKPQTPRTFNSNGSGQAQKQLFNRMDLKEAAQIFKRAAE
jgi:TonB family protein